MAGLDCKRSTRLISSAMHPCSVPLIRTIPARLVNTTKSPPLITKPEKLEFRLPSVRNHGWSQMNRLWHRLTSPSIQKPGCPIPFSLMGVRDVRGLIDFPISNSEQRIHLTNWNRAWVAILKSRLQKPNDISTDAQQ